MSEVKVADPVEITFPVATGGSTTRSLQLKQGEILQSVELRTIGQSAALLGQLRVLQLRGSDIILSQTLVRGWFSDDGVAIQERIVWNGLFRVPTGIQTVIRVGVVNETGSTETVSATAAYLGEVK